MKNFNLENVHCYKNSKRLGEIIYPLVLNWGYLDQKTTGTQLIRSTDSIAANIAEGFGRFHKKDKIKFFYNARASVFETSHWIETALQRNLIAKKDYEKLNTLLQQLPKDINYLIKMTQNNLKI